MCQLRPTAQDSEPGFSYAALAGGGQHVRIFLSHASQQVAVAEAVAVALRNAGHDVFLDKDSLPAAQSYDDRIRAAIGRSDMFLFLISPQSVDSGRYTLTELKFARERWPRPGNKVLPVMAVDTPIADIPVYLRALNILKPEGNLVAEVAALVEERGSAGPAMRVAATAAAALLVIGGLGGGAWWVTHNSSTVAKKVAIEAQAANCVVVNELLQVKSPDQLSQAAARQTEMCRELVALQGGDPRERQIADLMAQGETEQALSLLEQMAKGPPETVERWERLATLSALRDPDQALRAREAIERLDPASVSNRLQLAQLYAARRPQDWLRVNQDMLATASDPMAKALANWSLCAGSMQLVATHAEWNCGQLSVRQLMDAYGATRLDKRYASNAAVSVLTQRVTMMSLTASAGADPDAVVAAFADIAGGLKYFSQEQLRFVTNGNMSELLKIQVDEATVTGDLIAQMMTAARAGDRDGVRKVFASTNARLEAIAVRAQTLSASFNSPLVGVEQGAIAHSQGLLLLQEAVIGGAPATAEQQAAVMQKLRAAMDRLKAVHDQNPRIGVPLVSLVLLTQWIQSAEQAHADWLGPQLAADQLMWVNIVAAQKPNDPATRMMLLQSHYLAWKFAAPEAKEGEFKQVNALLSELGARADMAAAAGIIEAIKQDVQARAGPEAPTRQPSSEPASAEH